MQQRFSLYQTEKVLQPYLSDLGIYELDQDETLEKLSKLEMGPMDAAKLFLVSINAPENISKINKIFFDQVLESLSPKEAFLLAFHCHFERNLIDVVGYILNRTFGYNTQKSLLSASHFLYECILLDLDISFIIYGWNVLNDGSKMNIMYDLVGPEKKPIVQIVIENNLSELLYRLIDFVELSLNANRSMIRWLERSEIPLNPLFWISKDTDVSVIRAYSRYDLVFRELTSKVRLFSFMQSSKNALTKLFKSF